MHPAVREFVARHATGDAVTVLECGSRDVNGSVRDLFPSATWVGVDISDGPGVQVVADFADYRHPDPVDVVVCTEVLEHTPRWADIVRSAAANLRPGGMFLCTCAGPGRAPHSAVDGAPIREWEHYDNIDPTALLNVMGEGFARCEATQVGLDVQAVGWR